MIGWTDQQRDRDAERTSVCDGWFSGSGTAAGGQRQFSTSAETVQLPATVRNLSVSAVLIPHSCQSARVSLPAQRLTYHVLSALYQPTRLTFSISINSLFFLSHSLCFLFVFSSYSVNHHLPSFNIWMNVAQLLEFKINFHRNGF